MMINVDWLRCPISHSSLVLSEDGKWLISQAGQCRFPFENGIAMLLKEYALPLEGLAGLPPPNDGASR